MSRGTYVPKGAFTGVGSLPFEDAATAVDFVATYSPEVPFWPQLVTSDLVGTLLAHALRWLDLAAPASGQQPYELSPIDLAKLRRAASGEAPPVPDPPGLRALVSRLERFQGAKAVKGQVTGPLTLAHLLRRRGLPVIDQRDIVDLLADLVVRQALRQVEALSGAGLPVLVWVDEPALRLVARADVLAADMAVLRRVCGGIGAAGAVSGLHCCAFVEPGRLCESAADIVSFDALQGMTPPIGDRRALDFWAGSGTLAFGLVPPQDPSPEVGARDLFARWLLAGTFAGDLTRLAAHTMITATCGLALQSAAAAERSFVQAAELSALVRQAGAGPTPPVA